MFDDLCPAAIHHALTVHGAAHQARQAREINRVKEATNALNEALCMMNLPAAIEDTQGKKNIVLMRIFLNPPCMSPCYLTRARPHLYRVKHQ